MTIFTTTSYPVSALISDIDLGKVGLPDLQRPFVWPNVKVRNLFDSLYKGYPVGFLLFWATGVGSGLKGIGTKNAKAAPQLAIVDGQQRLTSLYAVVKGEEVIRANFKKERIRIAFNPLTERFAVADATTVKDKSFIPDIAGLWQPNVNIFKIAHDFLQELSAVRDLTDVEKLKIQNAIGKLYNLINQYSFTALTLSATADAATVADVFVRINGEGKKLNQSDFIMTLMSVHWDEGRTELEAFAQAAMKPSDGQASPFNHFIKPSPDQMLRATIGLALKRARLESVYNALRGRDAKTGIENPEKRAEQFAIMQQGQSAALNLANWHHFLSALTLAGYRGEKMISSETAIIYSYVLYLIGIKDFGIDKPTMRQAIAEFFFMATLTGRYTSTPETRFEAHLSMIRDLQDGAAYLAKLREICATTLTPDFWSITLPAQMATSAAQSPSLFAYNASLIKLDADVLFSDMKIASLVDPAIKGTKVALERHHLFPRAYLESQGIQDFKKINQIANFAPVEWPDNISIGSQAPTAYVPALDAVLPAAKREQLYFWHALPHLWWELPYEEFLVQRRERMARVIEAAWNRLKGDNTPAPQTTISVSDLINSGETDAVEFKSTMRVNRHTSQQDDRMQVSVLKTIAGFLNAKGGTLLIGVGDDGEVLGIEADGFSNEDAALLHLGNLISARLGDVFRPYVHPRFEDQEGGRVLVVRCEPGPRGAYLKDGQLQKFFVRGGNATAELQGSAITDYVRQRFG
jgi:hypothetical protein